jgi:hypothetical protein
MTVRASSGVRLAARGACLPPTDLLHSANVHSIHRASKPLVSMCMRRLKAREVHDSAE